MAFRDLPFKPVPEGHNLFYGEPVAPKWKRTISSLIDYWLGCALLAYAWREQFGSYDYPGQSASLFDNLLLYLPVLALLNSGVIQGIYGQSIGKMLTKTTLVTYYQRRLEVPGIGKASARVGIPIAAAFLMYWDFSTGENELKDSDATAYIMSAFLALSFIVACMDPKSRSLIDHITRTATIDVEIGERDSQNPNRNVRRPRL